MLVPHPGIRGPLPKLVPVLADALRRLGCVVETEVWSRHSDDESLLDKVVGRAGDLVHIRKHLARRAFDVLFISTAHNWPGLARDLPLVLLTRDLCPRRVVQFHGSSSERLLVAGGRLFKCFSRLLVSSCDAVLVLSEQERAEWKAFYPSGRFEVVANPFVPQSGDASGGDEGPPGEVRPQQPAGTRLLFVGRLMPEKGVFDVLEALALPSAASACHLRIAGSGPAAEAVRRRVSQLDLGARVTLCGYLGPAGLARAYAEADIFVLPTYYAEGFPTVILEAMYAGLPIVTTPVRGAADRLKDGENALFVPAHRPDLLATALQRLAGDHDLRARMGRENRRKVEEFAPDRVSPRYLEILRSVAAGGHDHAVERADFAGTS